MSSGGGGWAEPSNPLVVNWQSHAYLTRAF
jgi:hypothetical protein